MPKPSPVPPIFLLHGWSIDPASLEKWWTFEQLLSKKQYRITVLKIPGLSAPLHEVWDINNYIEWLKKELVAESKVILVGHSFGGHIAAKFASLYPNKVDKLILIDSSGIRDHSPIATLKRTAFWWAAKCGKVFFHSTFLRSLLYKLARERDYQQAPPLLRRTMSHILDDEVVADLPKIMSPTLLIWGSADKSTPLFMAKIFQKNIQHSQLHIVQGARHAPQFTNGLEVAQSIEHFIEG